MHQTSPAQRRQRLTRPHWSFSQVAQYQRCPLQYFFERIVRLPRSFTPTGLALGSAVHAALAAYHEQLLQGGRIVQHQIEDELLAAWRAIDEDRPIRLGEGESTVELIDLGLSLLEAYLREPPPENIVAVEQQVVVPLFNSQGAVLEKPLVVVLDLLCRDQQSLMIVEFKTSRRRYSELDLKTALQANCYVHAVRERSDWPVKLQYTVLVKTKTPQVQTLTDDCPEFESGRLGDTIEAVDRAIQAGAFYPVESPLNCSTCPYHAPCRDWQRKSRTTVVDLNTSVAREAISC
ncbi:MAG: PD-(D/E)XK nuclease family protein [Planctomycetota bacterium]|nr:MAG: PD-(D/E)XK nuclease family protein [Planctomycetota bacterium]REK25958.1 MAG: PD-(D/E)XK nuclease family protein [Planctomycetota bacterium]REK46926.1 MAG: PD-(D/E)XK nuclease family protein [Planctomycetota bacterium]